MKKVKVGLVGCGRVSRTAHYSAINKHSDLFEFIAVCDHVTERAETWAKENSVKAYTSFDAMLSNEELDLVAINTPNGSHAKLGIKAANAGVHVMVEKPLTMTLEDADALIDACEDNGVELFCVKQNRFNETNKLLKSCVDKGRFGRISSCNMVVSWRRELPYYTEDNGWRGQRDMAGGVFTNQSVHYIDMMQWLIGAPPETAYAKMGTLYPVEVEDHGAGIIKFKNGVIGSLVLTNHAYPNDVEGSITIIGETGMVKLGGKSMNKVVQWDFAAEDAEDELIKEAESNPPTVYGFGHYEYYERVGKYLLTGEGKENLVDGREGRKSVALLEGLYLSDRLAQEVRFPLGKR